MKRIGLDAFLFLALPLLLARYFQEFQAERFYQAAERQAQKQQWKPALSWYEQAAAWLPERAPYQRAVSQTAFRLYDPQVRNLAYLNQAGKAYQRMLALDPIYPYGWFEMGTVLAAVRGAEISSVPSPGPYFERALQLDPSNPRFLAGYLSWLLGEGRKDQARQLLPRLIVSSPNAISRFGPLLLSTHEERVRLGEQLGIQPAANVAYAGYLAQRQEKELARAQIQRLSGSDQLRADLAVPLAEVLVALDQSDQAKQILEGAFERSPERLAIAQQWAGILVKEGKLEAAIAVYRRALKKNPQAWELNLKIGGLARILGQEDLVLECYRAALASPRPTREQRKAMSIGEAEILARKGDLQGAIAACERALEWAPGDAKLAGALQKLRAEWESRKASAGGR